MIRLFLTVILVCASRLVWAMGSMPSSSVLEMTKGYPAAEFTLETVSRKSLTLTQAREGKKAVLFFWATWCPHCHEALEQIRQNLNALKEQNIQVLLVNVGESREEAGAFLKRLQIPLDSFVDEDNTVAGQYGVVGLPTVFLIDEKGIVRNVEHGFSLDDMNKFNAQ